MGLLLGYIVIGTVCYSVMVSAVERAVRLIFSEATISDFSRRDDCVSTPTRRSHSSCGKVRGLCVFVHNGQSSSETSKYCTILTRIQGWNYWYNWTIILPAELSAAAVLINYWNKSGKFDDLN